MLIPLPTSAKKILFLVISSAGAVLYLCFCGAEWRAAYLANQSSLISLRRAAQLEPVNADYRYRIGRYYLLVSQSPQQALPQFLSAVTLNPHRSDYWFSLANTYQLLGDPASERSALENAVESDPHTPSVAWEAANFYLAQGENDRALAEFRVVLASGSYRIPDSIRLCWEVKPDVQYLVKNLLPPDPGVYFSLLEELISRNEPAAAQELWVHLIQLNQPLERRYVFDYMHWLLARQDVLQAQRVWQESANRAGLSAYQPSAENLIINGDFSSPILNAGFDWNYTDVPGVELALDPAEARSGHQSLAISYDSSGLEDSGIQQQIPVQPNTRYEFSANFKCPELQGAGGPQFVIEEPSSGTIFLATDDLKDADFWKAVGGTFTTQANTKIVTLRIRRVPSGSPLRGKLWIDGVRLKRVANAGNSPSSMKASQ